VNEIYEDTLSILKYTIYIDGVAKDADGSVSVSVDGVSLGNSTKTPGKTGEYTILLPMTYNAKVGSIKVNWSFNYSTLPFIVTECYKIVKPYASWNLFVDKFAQYNKAYADYVEAERVVRYVINSYCGQSFETFEAAIRVEGNGLDGLILPHPLLSETNVQWSDGYNVIYTDTDIPWEISGNGWILRKQSTYDSFDPVCEPHDKFKRNVIYTVTGVWGYECIPNPVVESARLLIEDYICPDQNYRNKYLDNIRSGDWRLEFNDWAFVGTGNATVDRLLKEYRNYPAIGVI